jgi:hypothetical protein
MADGFRLLMIEFTDPMVKVAAFVSAPFVLTRMVIVPGDEISAAGMDAVTCDGLTNVVGREAPSQRTVELLANPEPLTVRVNAEPPDCTDDGFRLLRTVAGAPMVKGRPLLTALPALTVTVTPPGLAMRFAEMAAVS